MLSSIPAGIYLFKVNIRNTNTIYEIGSNLTIKTAEWRHWLHSAVIMVKYWEALKLSGTLVWNGLFTTHKVSHWVNVTKSVENGGFSHIYWRTWANFPKQTFSLSYPFFVIQVPRWKWLISVSFVLPIQCFYIPHIAKKPRWSSFFNF